MSERTFKADVGMVFITGRKDSLRVVKPAFKERRSGFIGLKMLKLQIASFSQVFPNIFPTFSQLFETFCAQKCSKQGNKGLRLLEMLKKPVGNCRNNLSCSSHTYVSRYVFLLLKSDLDIFLYPCQRPYHVEYTSSRPITEVKQH